MKDPAVSRRSRELEIRTIPAVVIDGKLVDYRRVGAVPNVTALRAAGVGTPLP